MLTGQSDVCLSLSLLSIVWCFLCGIIQPLLALETTDISVLVIETCLKFCPKMLLWLQGFSHGPQTSAGEGMNPVTGLVSACASHRHVCISWLTQVSPAVSWLKKCFPNKGIIIPTYFCVSCSPDIPRVVMEIKHGPQGQGKLVHCSVTVTSYLTPFFVTHYLIYHDIHTVYT